MTALLDGDLARAGAETGVALTAYFMNDHARWLWRMRLGQLTADPAGAPWITPVVVTDPDGVVVGRAGFHGPPDEAGMVEIGYEVLPEHRRRGYARATLAGLLRRAADDPRVRTVRASIRPDNAASLATIAGFGFTEIGAQWDEEDGWELQFEAPAARTIPG